MIAPAYTIDQDLCDLLCTLQLDQTAKAQYHHQQRQGDAHEAGTITMDCGNAVSDVFMLDSPSASESTPPNSDNSASNEGHKGWYGCAYLQALQSQLAEGACATTSGEYLEAIFTHREILSAYPEGHRPEQCARAFSDIAFAIERRAWRADRDADTEAVSAFRHEAWMIAANAPVKVSSSTPMSGLDETSRSGVLGGGCMMMPVF